MCDDIQYAGNIPTMHLLTPGHLYISYTLTESEYAIFFDW